VTIRALWPRALAPLALMALIFYLSAQPSVGPELPAFTRVAAHFTEYFALASLWLWALAPGLGRRAAPATAAIAVLYAISDEYHQSFVAGRHADPLDVLTDAAGAATACWIGWRLLQARGRASMRRTQSSSRG